MTLPTLDGFTKKVADLLDRPNQQITAIQLKEWFDAAPDELRVFLNARLAQIDTDFALKSEINNAILGQFPDNSITAVKLAFNAETIEGSQTKANTAEANAKNASVPLTQRGAPNGVATLLSDGSLVQKPYITGTYTGNGTRGTTMNVPYEQTINLGFGPSAVFVARKDYMQIGNDSGIAPLVYGGMFNANGGAPMNGVEPVTITASGFAARSQNVASNGGYYYGPAGNESGTVYIYTAFR